MKDARQMATQKVIGGTLPGIKFFEPKPCFVEWMKQSYSNSIIYDVGAGVGHVAKALSDQGLKVLSLDINYREGSEDSHILIADGESYQYQPRTVVMLCRPCHGEFVERVIDQAVRCRVSTVLYVGLKKNVEMDLGVYRKAFQESLSGAGLEEEAVWVCTLKS